ncbi:unnamed protein product, partial [Linum tenue]
QIPQSLLRIARGREPRVESRASYRHRLTLPLAITRRRESRPSAIAAARQPSHSFRRREPASCLLYSPAPFVASSPPTPFTKRRPVPLYCSH